MVLLQVDNVDATHRHIAELKKNHWREVSYCFWHLPTSDNRSRGAAPPVKLDVGNLPLSAGETPLNLGGAKLS